MYLVGQDYLLDVLRNGCKGVNVYGWFVVTTGWVCFSDQVIG